MRRMLPIAFAGALLAVPALSSVHAEYPDRPIRLIVGFGPGGATDTFARIFSGPLAKALNQTVLVENVPGASGYIGWRTVASAAPDGYTLMMAENALVIRPGFKDIKPQFDPTTEFTPIAFAATSPLAVCVANAVPANTMKELIALSHAAAKKLTFASAGVTSVSQLVWDVVRDGAKIEAIDVPYRGGGPAMTDALGGHVDLLVGSTALSMPQVNTGNLRALAQTGKTRNSFLANVPTVSESGYSGFEAYAWWGIFAPAGTPKPVIERFGGEMAASLREERISKQLIETQQVSLTLGGPQVLREFVASQMRVWGKVVKDHDIKGD